MRFVTVTVDKGFLLHYLSKEICPRGFMQKKKKLIIVRPFFKNFKLCKIAPKFAMIMQMVQKF